MSYNVNCPFGPLIYTTDISGQFHQFLLDGLDKCRNTQDAREYLLGNIEKQRYAPYDPTKFIDFINPHVMNYMKEKNERSNKTKETCNWDTTVGSPVIKESDIRYNLGAGPWVNFQQKGEFNPLHNHGGIVSAVVFIKIPEELKQERLKSTFSAKAAGCLEFVYMDQHIVVRPKEAMMYLFPAYLKHTVYPYQSDVERISMSFNLYEVMVDNVPVRPADDIVCYSDV
tara:strand:- start:616 stop:1296 length:681 start_codon:yes stop_codon:yes gene_type:complete